MHLCIWHCLDGGGYKPESWKGIRGPLISPFSSHQKLQKRTRQQKDYVSSFIQQSLHNRRGKTLPAYPSCPSSQELQGYPVRKNTQKKKIGLNGKTNKTKGNKKQANNCGTGEKSRCWLFAVSCESKREWEEK